MSGNFKAWQKHILTHMRPRKGRNGRYVLFARENQEIFYMLTALGAFKFYKTNKGRIIGVSQVVAFLCCGGYKAYKNGFEAPKHEIEVHHINGDITDNSEENLVYVGKQDHLILSSATNTPFKGDVTLKKPTPFNKQGQQVKNPKHYLANLLQETLKAVATKRSGFGLKLSIPLLVRNLPKNLHTTIVRSYYPEWFNKLFQRLLHTDDENLRFEPIV